MLFALPASMGMGGRLWVEFDLVYSLFECTETNCKMYQIFSSENVTTLEMFAKWSDVL